MSKKQMVKVDRKSVEKFLKERGMTLESAALKMDYSRNYFYKAFSTDSRIAVTVVKMLEVMFGIPADEIIIKDSQEPVVDTCVTTSADTEREPIDYDKLYDVMYRAVRDALMA